MVGLEMNSEVRPLKKHESKFLFKRRKNFANRKNVTLKLQIYEKTTEKTSFFAI